MEPSVARQWVDYQSFLFFFLYKRQSGVFFAVQQICFQNWQDLWNNMTTTSSIWMCNLIQFDMFILWMLEHCMFKWKCRHRGRLHCGGSSASLPPSFPIRTIQNHIGLLPWAPLIRFHHVLKPNEVQRDVDSTAENSAVLARVQNQPRYAKRLNSAPNLSTCLSVIYAAPFLKNIQFISSGYSEGISLCCPLVVALRYQTA